MLAFIKAKLLEKDTPPPVLLDHGATGPSAEAAAVRGVKSIRLNLANYLANSLLLTLSPPLPIQESLIAQWAFDKEGRLIALFLDRAEKEKTEAPRRASLSVARFRASPFL